jgi:hypothetical protein
MVELFVVLLAINLAGVIACHRIAKARGSKHVVFWTTMGIIFGPLAIPFVLRFNSEARSTKDMHVT